MFLSPAHKLVFRSSRADTDSKQQSVAIKIDCENTFKLSAGVSIQNF